MNMWDHISPADLHGKSRRGPWICEFCGFRVNNNGPDPDPAVMCCEERRMKEEWERLRRVLEDEAA
jgi:hypothetical protein